MISRDLLIVLCLAIATFATAFAVVHSKHTSRMLFKQSRALQDLIDQANVEGGRLQIEESTLSRYGRIEELASTELEMISPAHEDIRTVAE